MGAIRALCKALLLMLALAPPVVYAQTRPVIGLVLSGGGARGGAHIGALQALEELRVPIHRIAGTSIGAAIGGFYASGMSVEELRDFIGELDFNAAFLNTTPRQSRSFRRKRDDDLFLVGQRPGLNDGEFDLPTGVVQGQVIDLIMARVTLPVSGISDFDDLMIPFRAVAGDIVTGESVVLGEGALNTAIRASMGIPAVLTPVEIDDRLLVDGGIAMNLPVSVVQDMGADVVIAIDITTELYPREDLDSLVDITAQLTALLVLGGVQPQLELLDDDDVLITPEFEQELSSVSFNRILETVDRGYESVMAQRDALQRYALSPEQYAAYRSSLSDPRMRDLPQIDFVRIENDSIIADSIIEDRLGGIRLGEPLDVDAVERAISRVYGLELYQTVNYAVVDEGGVSGLEVDLNSRSWGPNYLQLGVEYSSAGDSSSIFGLAAGYLRTAVNERGGEWRATFVVGDEPGFLTEFHQPLGPAGRYFFSPSLDFDSILYNEYAGVDLVAEWSLREVGLTLAGGRELGTWGEIRGGLRRAYGETHLQVGDPALIPETDNRRGEFFARFSVDTLDSMSFPRVGVLAAVEWRAGNSELLSADVDYDQLVVTSGFAKSWGRHTLLSTLRYDATISGTAPLDRLFRIGGFFDLSGLNRNQFYGQHATRIGASYYRRIGDLALFPAFAGVSVELGNVWESRSDISFDDSLFGGSLWAGVDTPIGPVYVAYGMAEGGRNALYVVLGRIF
ncbi:MAG TPA: patatin-like phospholipase family protein [Gammaproteobacteria bacterium]|nr:patatin-like phospholipase family protein [Gammaproteobacteria bacterium]